MVKDIRCLHVVKVVFIRTEHPFSQRAHPGTKVAAEVRLKNYENITSTTMYKESCWFFLPVHFLRRRDRIKPHYFFCRNSQTSKARFSEAN